MSDFQLQDYEPLKLQPALQRAGIYAAITTTLALVFYILGPSVMVNPAVGIGQLALYIILPLVLGQMERKANYAGGYMSYGTAWQMLMVFTVVSATAAVLLQVIWFTVVDPNFAQAMAEASVENTIKMMENFGATGDELDRDVLESQMLAGFEISAFNLLKTTGTALIGGAIFNALIALGVRKKMPEMQ